jgi:hypothetical protein
MFGPVYETGRRSTMAKRQKGERPTAYLPTHRQRIAKDTRFPITTHKQMATFSTKLISCLSPISKGKNSGKQGKKSRAAYIPFLFFDFRPSIHTHTQS